MAISGSGGWIPSNQLRLVDGEIEFVGITQNKPKDVVESDPFLAALRLWLGQMVTVDVRHPNVDTIRAALCRVEVLAAISRERAYQDAKYGTIEERELGIGTYIMIAGDELAECSFSLVDDDTNNALCELLQVAAVCVAALERHGFVERLESDL